MDPVTPPPAPSDAPAPVAPATVPTQQPAPNPFAVYGGATQPDTPQAYVPPPGLPTPPGQPGQYPPQHDNSYVMAIVGLVMAIVFPIAGIIVSILALKEMKKYGHQSRGLAIAGIVIAGVQIALVVLGVLLLLILAVIGDTQASSPANDSSANSTSTTSQAADRDSERRYDLVGLEDALNAYYADHGTYPNATAFNQQSWSDPYAYDAFVEPETFDDPNGGSYDYDVSQASCTSSGCDSYQLSANLEQADENGSRTYTVSSNRANSLPYNEK